MADSSSDSSVPQPRETTVLFGHAEAEQTLLDAYRSGRVPHAWLIGGPSGIGKATLAYRMARFVLAHPDPAAPAVQKAKSLAVAPDHPVARRIAGQAHSDLLTIHRVINEKTGKLFTETRVEDVRRSVPFFGSTAGEGGWRVAIVDPVEDLNRNGENALLKVLEEPPPRALLLLVSHAPGRVLPTIRSRCRTLLLRPLELEGCHARPPRRSAKKRQRPKSAPPAAADGSVGRALMLLEGDALELRAAGDRAARPAAAVRSAGFARARRRARRHRGRNPDGVHGCRQRLAERAAAVVPGQSANGPRRRCMGECEPRRARSRDLQPRPQAVRLFRVQPARRSRTGLGKGPIDDTAESPC